jgi:hypothetical protein
LSRGPGLIEKRNGRRSDATCVLLLRDALARVIRANEALQDGELQLAAAILDDLEADLWTQIERLEKAA